MGKINILSITLPFPHEFDEVEIISKLTVQLFEAHKCHIFTSIFSLSNSDMT